MLKYYFADVVVLVVGKISPHRSGRECIDQLFGGSFQWDYFSVGNKLICSKITILRP